MANYEFLMDDWHWSFSRLNAFYTCPYMWKLSYIDCEKGLSNSFADFGTLVHSILERYANGELEIYELADIYEKEYRLAVPLPFPPNKYVSLADKYYEAGYEYLANFEGFGDYEIVEAEKELKFEINNYKVTGYIDLLLKDKEGNLHIFDHKSSTVKSETSEKANEYWKQLLLYSIGIYQEYGVYPKKIHVNAFKEGELYTVEILNGFEDLESINNTLPKKQRKLKFNERDIEKVKQWVIDTIEALKKEEKFLPKSDSFFCNFICNFRNGMCEYKPNQY